MYEVIHDAAENVFYTEVDGYTAYVKYKIRGGALNIMHTVVPDPISGRGVASRLVAATYAYADEQGLRREAVCPYAELWLKRHE